MQRLKYLAIILFSTMISLSISAQPLEVETLYEMSENLEKTNAKLSSISSIIQFKKKQRKDVYLDSDWSSAVVYTKEKEFLNCSARYNIRKNRMEIKLGRHVRKLMINKINGIIIEESLFVPISSEENVTQAVTGYYEVLAKGELALTYKYNLTLHSVGGTSMHQNLGTKQEYRVNKDLFYCQNGENALKFKKGKKNVLKVFTNHRAEMEAFASSTSTGFKKEKDLITLFNKYNELN